MSNSSLKKAFSSVAFRVVVDKQEEKEEEEFQNWKKKMMIVDELPWNSNESWEKEDKFLRENKEENKETNVDNSTSTFTCSSDDAGYDTDKEDNGDDSDTENNPDSDDDVHFRVYPEADAHVMCHTDDSDDDVSDPYECNCNKCAYCSGSSSYGYQDVCLSYVSYPIECNCNQCVYCTGTFPCGCQDVCLCDRCDVTD